MTREEIIAYQAELNKFRTFPAGVAFFKFKNASSSAWTADAEDSFTDKDRASTKAKHEKLAEAERELMSEIKKLIPNYE